MPETTVIDLTALTMQWGGWGIVLTAIIIAIRAVWNNLKPHIDALLKAKLKRYEATTNLTSKLQDTIATLVQQHQQMIEIMDRLGADSRANRKAIRAIARLMADHQCLAGVNVQQELSDSDEFGDDDSSDSGDK